jgi:dipeptide transport system permease protein
MMLAYLARRLLVLIPTFFGVSLMAFFLIRLVPGDPVLLMLGERGGSPEVQAEMRRTLGLDQPLAVQYGRYVGRALKGDLGLSTVSRKPVWDEFKSRFPATLELGLLALGLAVLIGIPLGLLAAVRRNTVVDYSVMGFSLVGYSMPIFWWGLLLILIFSVSLGLTPVSGRLGFEFDIAPVTGFFLIDSFLSGGGWPAFLDALHHMILPAVALGTIPLATIARMTRSSLLEVLGEDYIRTAKAKGLSPWRVVWVHGLRNALIPVTTSIGLLLSTIVTGAILTETIFSWPGIGKWMVASVTSRDYPVIQGGLLLIAGLIVFVNMMVDIVYALVNPRIRSVV